MRVSLPLALVAAAVTTGCATNRCADCVRCACPAVPTQAGCHSISPLPEPEPPAEPAEEAPAAPEAAQLPEQVEPTQPVSTGGDDYAFYGHGPNYRWLVGRLERVGGAGAWWRLHYAVPDARPQQGRSIVLAPDIRLEEYAEGDFVYVQGEVLADTAQGPRGPLYRVRIIRPATAGDRERVAAELR